jgi:hypothetical protein
MLRRHQDLLDRHGDVVAVPHRDLGLAVGAQERNVSALARLAQTGGQSVGERNRHRHHFRRLVRRVAEHHPLVTSSLPVELVAAALLASFDRGVDALGNVRGLLVERAEDRASVAIEAARPRIPDPADRGADDVGDVEQGGRGDLAGDDHQPSGHQRLACDP